MIETPQSILAPDGSSALRALVAAGEGRVSGAHFGTYDYTALCGITAAWQHMRHDACDFAKHMMQVALAQSGVKLSDGATNIMPVAPHRRRGGPAALRRPAAREPRGRPSRVEDPFRRRDAFARERFLPGLGPAPGAAADRATPRSTRSSWRRGRRRRRACGTSSTRRRRRRSSGMSSTTPRRGRAS